MTEKEQALAYLGRDPVLNISMTEPLRLGRAHVAARSSRGVVLEMDGIAMVAAEAPDEALRLLEAVPEANTWNVMGGALTQAVAEALDLEAGVMFGAFVDGRLAGFVGEHHEGSMGMLEVFPPYRGHGLGLALESFQINRYLSQGRVPFDQVIVGNEKSMGLQRKVGMELSKDTMSWLHRK